jgi:integrase
MSTPASTIEVEQSIAEVGGRLVVGTTKSHARRQVPLPAMPARALEAHLAEHVGASPQAYVLTGARGGALRHSSFYSREWRPTLRRIGLRHVGIHTPRHSAAATMISAGASPKAVQAVLGRQSAAFTLTVCHM